MSGGRHDHVDALSTNTVSPVASSERALLTWLAVQALTPVVEWQCRAQLQLIWPAGSQHRSESKCDADLQDHPSSTHTLETRLADTHTHAHTATSSLTPQLRERGPAGAALVAAAQPVRDPVAGAREGVEVDAGGGAEAMQGVHEVLGGEVAGGAGAEGAAAEAGDGGRRRRARRARGRRRRWPGRSQTCRAGAGQCRPSRRRRRAARRAAPPSTAPCPCPSCPRPRWRRRPSPAG